MNRYSTSQMHDFFCELRDGEVRVSGVMNYIQHLFIAQRCPPGAFILDACCGRALLLPLLARYAPDPHLYVGLDISRDNLAEAVRSLASFSLLPPRFAYAFVCADVSKCASVLRPPFDVIAYTSSLEHLPREEGVRSLHQLGSLLARDGLLYLSTPCSTPRGLQYSVHVYEWHPAELLETLDGAGLEVCDSIGLLPPPSDELDHAIRREFGDGAVAWHSAMLRSVPGPFLEPITAAAFPGICREVLHVCKRRSS